MIDADTINQLPIQLRRPLMEDLAGIYLTRVIQAQIQKERDKILSGDSDQPVEEAAAELLKARRTIQSLQSFEQLCYSYYKELNNA